MQKNDALLHKPDDQNNDMIPSEDQQLYIILNLTLETGKYPEDVRQGEM